MSTLVIAQYPLSVVRDIRSTHALEYRNNRAFDRTFGAFKVIPHCLNLWATNGLRLDEQFVYDLWIDHAEKKPGKEDGEMARASKLVLDAFRAVYDMAAVSHFTGLQLAYNEAEDMAGKDMLLMIPGREPTWIQLNIENPGQDFQRIKRARRDHRGELVHVYVPTLTARGAFVDRQFQPWVPTDEWYSSIVELLDGEVDANG